MRFNFFISGLFLLGFSFPLQISASAETQQSFKEGSELFLVAQSSSTIVLDLGLTNAQIFQLNEVREDYSPQIEQLYSEWLAATDTLDTLLVSEAATEAEVTTQFQNVESLRSELATSEFERDLAIWKILEPEQRLPFEQYFEQLNQQ